MPDLNTGRESPYVTVQYDPDDRVESICLVASTDDVFFPPILAANLAEEHNLKPGEHYVSKVDQQNQPVEMIETWNTVLGNPNSPKRVYLKRRPVKKTEVLAEPPYHRTSTAEGWSESSKKFGDQSMWIPNNQGGGCKLTFLYNGQFYEITTSHHEHFLTEVPKLGTDVLKTQKRLEVESR